MNNHHDIERLLKERLIPAAITEEMGQRLRGTWLPAAAATSSDEPERRLRLRLHAWQWAFAAAAAAAVILGVFRLYMPAPAAPAATQPAWAATPTSHPHPQTIPTPTNQPDEIRQHILGADDLGLVGSPATTNRARQVRVRYLETQRWQDPAGGWIERARPQEATLLIPIRELHDDGTGNIQAGPVHIIRPTP